MQKEVAGLNEVWKRGQAGVRIICGQRCGIDNRKGLVEKLFLMMCILSKHGDSPFVMLLFHYYINDFFCFVHNVIRMELL